jgi:phage terminase large subunit-like protein
MKNTTKAAAINSVNKVANEVNVKIRELFEKVPPKFKANNSEMFSATHAEVYNVLNQIKGDNKKMRIWTTTTEYSFSVSIDEWYENGAGANYYRQDVYILDRYNNKFYNWEDRKTTTEAELDRAEKDLSFLQEKEREIQSEISRLKRLLNY